jgi:menaquinone-dependent protoporphyrinogen oxidase
MRMILFVASKHGATEEIGDFLAKAFAHEGIEVDRYWPGEAIVTEHPIDAAVIGSAVYGGHWLGEARKWISNEWHTLRDIPVWLFSSGPVGDPLQPDEDPADIEAISNVLRVRGHARFGGKLDREKLGFGERAIVKALRAETGDFRDWVAVEAWARSLAEALQAAGAER